MAPEIERLLRTLPAVGRPRGRLRVVGSVGTEGVVVDGLGCGVFREEGADRFWFHLSGGVGGVDQWYGPVDAGEERGKVVLGWFRRV